MHTLDHVTVSVSDYARAKEFYTRALALLGVRLLMEFGQAAGFGRTRPELWIGCGAASFQTPRTPRVDHARPRRDRSRVARGG